MHILQIYKDYLPVLGGIEQHMADLSTGLAQRGYRFTVLVTHPGRGTVIEQPAPNIRVIRAASLFKAASTPLSLAMLQYARQIHADVVHLHFPYPPGDLAALLAAGRPPLVLTYHSDIVRQQRMLQLYQPLLRRTLQRASQIIATSPAYIQTSPWLAPYAHKCVVVSSSVDPLRFGHADPHAINAWRRRLGPGPLALFVGRLRYYKGLHILLEALAAASGMTMVIAGTGPEAERLRNQAQQLGILDRVLFLGDVRDADLPALYQAVDLFVLPAHLRAEALGLAQLEAMASGLPCISTELGTGTSYTNQHGITGLVVPASDAMALAQALRRLASDAGLRQQYGQAARQRVLEHFTIEQMLNRVEQVYHEVVH